MPTTWSVVTSCLASEAICDGLVCSVTGKNLIGCPLIPPLAFTQAKYAPVMFSMSLKSVPGCLVLIAPMLIGVPVAATPGLVPQADVETVLADEELDATRRRRCSRPGALDGGRGADVELVELELQRGEDAERQRRDDGGRRPRPPVDGSIHVFCLLVANRESLFFRTDACSAFRGSAPPPGG